MTNRDTAPDDYLASNDDLDVILIRCEAATAGPWESFVEGHDHHGGDSCIRRGGLDDAVEDFYISQWRIEDQLVVQLV